MFNPSKRTFLVLFRVEASSHIFEASSHIFVASSHIFEASSHIYDGLNENKAKLSSVELSWSLAEIGKKSSHNRKNLIKI